MKFPAWNVTTELLALHFTRHQEELLVMSQINHELSGVLFLFCFFYITIWPVCTYKYLCNPMTEKLKQMWLFLLVRQPPASKLECSVSRWKKSNMNLPPLVFSLASSLTILMSHAFFRNKLPSGQNTLPSLLSSMKIPGELKTASAPGRP